MSDLCRAPFEILTAVLFICFFAIQNDMVSLLLIAIVGFPTCMLPIVWIGKQIRRWSKRLLEQSAGIGSNFHENLTCIKIVKAYNTETSEVAKYKEFNLNAFKICMRATRWSILVGPLTETVAFLLAAIFVAYCLATGHGLSEIIPLIPPFLILYKPMKQLGRLQVALENGRAALQRIFSLLDVHQELDEKEDAKPLTEFKEALIFDNVSFGYDTKKEKVITDANFTIKPGQMFAVVGSTGSGKSTLANLLARFYDVTAGKITIDGCDLRDYRIADLRKTIGAVTQEALLFNTTIAANIAYGSPTATQEEIEAAAKLANAHEFIMAHPEGYQRIVGEKGFVLSGGERQRVAIARAILKNPPILILDEATSALDTVTEQQVQSAINNLMKNRTTFAIAHRLSTIRQADCILVLDHGNIVERGTHEELYAKGGVYRNLCDIQNQQA
jgi:subfamily B ATP-binding cassette protein MsbA